MQIAANVKFERTGERRFDGGEVCSSIVEQRMAMTRREQCAALANGVSCRHRYSSRSVLGISGSLIAVVFRSGVRVKESSLRYIAGPGLAAPILLFPAVSLAPLSPGIWSRNSGENT